MSGARRTEAMGGRARQLLWVVVAGFGLLCGRLAWMQVAMGEHYRRLAHERMQLPRTLEPRRGRIVDRNGEALVHNALAYDIHAVPSKVTPEGLGRLAARLPEGCPERDPALMQAAVERVKQEALAWMKDDLERRFGKASPRRKAWAERSLTRYFMRRAYPLIEDVGDMDLVRELFVDRAAYPGLLVRSRPVRRHPQGATAGHLVGYMGRVTAEDYATLRTKGYRPTDWLGRRGLERAFEDPLRGERGVEIRGRRKQQGRPVIIYRDAPSDGEDLQLTLDLSIQRLAEHVLDRRLVELEHDGKHEARYKPYDPADYERPPKPLPRGAAAVLIDVHSGAVLAMASAPRFAPGSFSKDYARLRDDVDKPLFDRCIRPPSTPPPGSVFKLLTALAGLEEGIIHRASDAHVCHGYMYERGKFRCWKRSGHGAMDLIDSIAYSCNIYYYHTGERLDSARMAWWGRQFGFGEPTGIELPERHGTMPEAAWAHFHGRDWNKASKRFVGIGQGAVSTTPAQVARFYAGMATRGLVPRLRLLASTPVERRRVAVSGRTWDLLERGMLAVVSRGTASRYGLEEFGTAAKTGTAETGGNPTRQTHAWIAGYAPARQPEVAFCVFVEHSGHGGDVCGPVAYRLLESYFEPERAQDRLARELQPPAEEDAWRDAQGD